MPRSRHINLGNLIWSSLTGEHRHLALGDKKARRYHPDISPFAALSDNSEESLSDLAALVSPGEVVLLRDEIPDQSGEWRLERQTPSLQMILPSDVHVVAHSGLHRLSHDDVPAMLELTQLMLPGYFRQRSLEMGSFFGIFDGSKLIAMTGERVFPYPYREITAVCTHPDYQGRGYAAKLVGHVATLMRKSGLTPFLHTGVANARAIALYSRLGFADNGVVPLTGIRRL